MDQKIRKQSKKSVGISLERLIEGFAKGVTGLWGLPRTSGARKR